ncbi:MAG: hypothetical protein Tsb0010_19320 [Parvularculaceae bacterium]
MARDNVIKFPGVAQAPEEGSESPPQESADGVGDASAAEAGSDLALPKPKKRDKPKRGLGARGRSAQSPEKARARRRAKALREIARIEDKIAEQGEDALSDWEREFLSSVKGRLEEYDAAFRDPEKGAASEALSFRQQTKLREVKKKAKESEAPKK